MPIKPNLNAFLLCDQVLRDQHGRCSLIGVFQHLRSPQLPLPPRNFSIFVSLSDVVTPSQLTLRFWDPSREKILQEVAIDCQKTVTPNQPYEINADFSNVVFDKEGDWDFELCADKHLLGLRCLKVSKL